MISIENQDKREFYIAETEKNNWTTRQLERQVNSQLFERLLLSNNVKEVLAVAREEKLPTDAKEIIKDPIVLEFLGLKREAENIPILKMDNGVTREHASYNGEGIKQADVNLLAYPLKGITDEQQIKKDLEYYETRVPNEGTPAMTQAVFATLYARLGNGEKAFHWFKDAYRPNLNPPFRVIAETKGGTNPYFATGAGGILQSVLMGFGGLEITDKGITKLKSALPKDWKRLKITGVGIDKKTFTVE